MRIPSISSALFSYQKDNHYQQKNKTSFISFAALDINRLKKMPLEKKLTHMFSTVEKGDLIVVGKALKDLQEGLTRAINKYHSIINRLLFIKHGGIAVPLAFSIEEDEENMGDIQCINIGDKPIILATENSTIELTPDSSSSILDGDVIINNRVNIPVQTKADYSEYIHEGGDTSNDMNILLNPESFASETHDFADMQQAWVEKANENALKSLYIKTEVSTNKENKLSFNDVGGLDEVITKLKKGILYPVEFPFAYENKKSMNRGFILYGPPGTGKTLLAQALASEVNAHYTKLNGLEMESKWVGESEKNWRELFETAKENAPSIIFIDEFDAVARNRGGQDVHGDKVVNQLLTLMSDIEKENQKIFVIAATNKLESLDNAIVRSGRFGEYINVPAPDRDGLDKIYEVHARGKNIDAEFNKSKFLDACASKKFTGADLAFLINKAEDASWDRCGIYEKMEQHILTKEDIAEAKIGEIDFNKALNEMMETRSKTSRNPIGYTNN